jgi:bifunctional non-homologous end joining protein LigD
MNKSKAKKQTATTETPVQRRLLTYRKKRDFEKTREPAGERAPRDKVKGLSFVIQKHAARRLHYDFRLELDGVLLSWSVPKGPSLKAGERRLAVRTEDHPLAYADFEGIIPKGQYGGGTVIVWDHGTWSPEGDPRTSMKKGRLTFDLLGEKLHGRFHLVRTHGMGKGENWLLFKGRDGEASEIDLTEERPESALTGRTIEQVAVDEDRVWQSKPRKGAKKSASSHGKESTPRKKMADPDVVSVVKRLPVQFPLTNLEKVLYPEQGLRKADLIAYLVSVAEWMLPHLAGRPLTLVRCPEGRQKQCFFQKHAKDSVPDIVQRVAITEEKDEQDYMAVHDAMGLVALAQLGALELHTWTCHADAPEKPDQLVFDLDPDETLPWSAVVEAAYDVKKELDALGFATFVKTTGGKGLHVVVPLLRRHSWQQHKAFAHALVQRVCRQYPKRFVVTARKDQRKGRIFLDYLRNGRGATAVAPYSTRAREGATVATPVHWEELERGINPKDFTVRTLLARMQELKADPWHDYANARKTLSAAVLREVVPKHAKRRSAR